MFTHKCEKCGEDIHPEKNMDFDECYSCYLTSASAEVYNKAVADLLIRANNYRSQNDFEQAMSIYKTILGRDTNNDEAYMGFVLCQYNLGVYENWR